MITYVFYQKLSKPCFYNVLIWPLFIGSLWLALKKMLFLQDFNLFLQNAPKMTYASEFSSFFRSFWYIWESWAMMSSSWKIRKTIKFFCTLSDSDTKFWSTRKSAGSNPTHGNMIFFSNLFSVFYYVQSLFG